MPLRRARLAGGAARNPRLVQLFADALGMAVETVAADEVSALGAALAAAVGCGAYADVARAVAAAVVVKERHTPDPANARWLDAAYGRYRLAVDAMRPVWDELARVER
jgi:L-xylulokinase